MRKLIAPCLLLSLSACCFPSANIANPNYDATLPVAASLSVGSLPAGAQEQRIVRILQQAPPDASPRQLLLREGFSCSGLRCERRFVRTVEFRHTCVVVTGSHQQAFDIRVELDEGGAVRSVTATTTSSQWERH